MKSSSSETLGSSFLLQEDNDLEYLGKCLDSIRLEVSLRK